MGDQTLRDALEKRLETLPVVQHENGYPVQALPKAELLALLAAHPAEPQSAAVGVDYHYEITDELVERAAQAAWDAVPFKWKDEYGLWQPMPSWAMAGDTDRIPARERMRAALEAAQPFMTSRTAVPVPTLEQAIKALHEYQHGAKLCVQGNCRKRDTAARLAPAVLALFTKGTEA